MAILNPAASIRVKSAIVLLGMSLLSACSTTSRSDRIDRTGEELAGNSVSGEPESSAYYIQSLRGGLVSRIAGVKLSTADRARALEAEYKALETTPSGQSVAWAGSGGTTGQVVAAVPYQVGSQNCRQYTHTVVASGAAPMLARGAACRNANGSWTPL